MPMHPAELSDLAVCNSIGQATAAAGLTYVLASSTHTDLLAANRRAVVAADEGDLTVPAGRG